MKKQRHYFADKSLCSQSYGFPSSHVWMWELDHNEGWALKNWCFQIELEKTFESLLDCKEIKQSILKEIEAEYSLEGLRLKLQYFGHLMQRAHSLGKTLMLGKVEGRRRRGQQRIRWLDGITNQAPGDGDGQGSLECCSPWGCKESDMAEWLNNNKIGTFVLKGKRLETRRAIKCLSKSKTQPWIEEGKERKRDIHYCKEWIN